MAFSRDGNFLASAGFDGIVQVWNMDNLDNLPVLLRDHASQVWSVDFSADGKYLYAGCQDGSIKIWPVDPVTIAARLKGKLNRNMSREEWLRYVARNIPYETTIDKNP